MNTYILFFVIISNSLAEIDPSRILHGVFSDSNTTQIYYGSVNFDTETFNIFSSLNVRDVGDPRRSKYSVLPLTYDPNDDVIFMAAPNNDKQTILSVINATTGNLIRTFKSISNTIISLQFDIFQKQLFSHVESEKENTTLLVEIDLNNGNIKQILATIQNSKATYISSYCPICRKYFLIMIEDQSIVYVGVNTSNQGGIDWKSKLDYSPMSIRFDYKTFTMYSTYVNVSIGYVSSIGILDRMSGKISKNVGIISDSPDVGITSLSAFDIEQKIYYASITLDSVFPRGISYVDVENSQSAQNFFPKAQYNSHAWFVKQFVH